MNGDLVVERRMLLERRSSFNGDRLLVETVTGENIATKRRTPRVEEPDNFFFSSLLQEEEMPQGFEWTYWSRSLEIVYGWEVDAEPFESEFPLRHFPPKSSNVNKKGNSNKDTGKNFGRNSRA